MITIQDLETYALAALENSVDGSGLDPLSASLIELGCCASVCSLDRYATNCAIEKAFGAGASVDQVQEILALVSGLGVHTLMTTAQSVYDIAARNKLLDREMDEAREKLWARYVGDNPFWKGFEKEVPGFLRAMLILSPDLFQGFFEYCAIPWKSGTVRAIVKELTAAATDATISHRFAPGFKIHLRNAIALGATRTMVLETLAIAARTPAHTGTT